MQCRTYSTPLADFRDMVDNLIAQIPFCETPLRFVFFGASPTNEVYVERKNILNSRMKEAFEGRLPIVSYVSQPTMGGGLTLEVQSFLADETDTIARRCFKGFPYVVIENAEGRFLFAGGFQGNVLEQSLEEQTLFVFETLDELLSLEHFPIDSIIRQWNYVERITDFSGADQNYQILNNVRSAFYAKAEWANGYPAATGIGANLGGILVDVDAAVFKKSDCFAKAIDNPLQVAAHAYSDSVLEEATKLKTTPKFERAKAMHFGSHTFIYISGTAAIRGEESLQGVGIAEQLRITMENIAVLIKDCPLRMLRVYLKEEEFYVEAKRLMDAYKLDIPIIYMWTDVCRDELLIEIEGMAGN